MPRGDILGGGAGPRALGDLGGDLSGHSWGQKISSHNKLNEWKLFVGQVPLEVRKASALLCEVHAVAVLCKPGRLTLPVAEFDSPAPRATDARVASASSGGAAERPRRRRRVLAARLHASLGPALACGPASSPLAAPALDEAALGTEGRGRRPVPDTLHPCSDPTPPSST